MKTLIVYGSTTGNNERVAQIIADKMISRGRDIVLKNVRDVKVDLLSEFELILLGSSTWGDGELQDDMIPFFEDINTINLSGKKTASFGVGEDSWPQFCNAVEMIEDKLKEIGGELVIESLKVNGDADTSNGLIEDWAEKLVANTN